MKIEEFEETLNGEHQETQRNVSPSEQEEDERGPMPTSAIKDLFKKWDAVRAMVLEWYPNQADVSRVGDLYNNNDGTSDRFATESVCAEEIAYEKLRKEFCQKRG
ncbi:uncharacterized protein TNCV_2811551 [Trichonephila clavipes]|nr:uncharacterized protein TNCV_2811551 [Trichonephila clavipes]